ncbi:MAG: hypothetical protein PHV32_11925 [Eubacteriales bacterium]|nr:hypothetical protein [Eubacteriales bacterium]
MKKVKMPLLLILVVLFITLVTYIVISNLLESNKIISPDGNYKTTYNRFTNIVKVENIESGIKYYELIDYCSPAKSPLFSWSPDSRYLAMTYTDSRGYALTQMTSFLNSSGFSTPQKREIQNACGGTETENANIYVSEWLDNNHALIKFSWTSENSEKITSGWFTYQISPHSIIDLHVTE